MIKPNVTLSHRGPPTVLFARMEVSALVVNVLHAHLLVALALDLLQTTAFCAPLVHTASMATVLPQIRMEYVKGQME